MNSGAGDFSVTYPEGVSTSNKFTYDGKGGLTTVDVESSMMYPIIHRSRRGQALIYFMFAINWIMTLCSMITTSVIFNREGKVKNGVALSPITVILTIPAIRSLYPGSPPFGIYLGAHRNCTALFFRGLTIRFRRGRILPTNVYRGSVHCDGAVVLFKGLYGAWGSGYPRESAGSCLTERPS